MSDLLAGTEPILPRLVPLRRRGGLRWCVTVPGRPTSKGNSQRKTRHSVRVSEAAERAAADMGWLIADKRPRRLLSGHLYVEVEFRFAIPKSGENRRRQAGEYRLPVPDRGNTLKLVEDVCAGVVYENDATIVDGPPRKVWWPRDETLIVVTEIEPFPITAATALRMLQQADQATQKGPR